MLISQKNQGKIEPGCDEAGRGCLAGPVTAAAVILKDDFLNNDINDSKKISKKNRYVLKEIIEKNALEFSCSHTYPKKIDEINILNASILTMHKSINKLLTKIDFIIVDGNKFKSYKNIPHQTIIKGDEKFLSIAAASIIAKTERDNYMNKIHEEYPQYGWDKNKGYPTKFHKQAILKYGTTKYHRKSFKLFDEQFKLKL